MVVNLRKILALGLLAAIAACTKPADTEAPAPASTPPPIAIATVAWRHASNDADVDAAFATAVASDMPVFVYWGDAQWCPPCNLVKATVFNRQDFIERSRAFVPVYIDGDSPGAQKLGARFHVSGYPTMVLFSPQGVELTRLPGEVDAARYTEVLTLGMSARRPVKDLLARALQPSTPSIELDANDWRALAFYSWDTDEAQLVQKDGRPALLKQLADACPADLNDIATRLRLKALAAAETQTPAASDAVQQTILLETLADANAARAQMDVLTNYAAEITRAATAPGTAQRADVLAAFDATLKQLAVDPTLSRADRAMALVARVNLAKIDAPADLPPALLEGVRQLAADFDRDISDGYERQAVIPTVAYALEHAGLADEADALLTRNLPKSHSPYYLMLELASNAKSRGDTTAALHWYQEAFNTSEGPATRLQWGAEYVKALTDLSPQDETRIEATAAQLLTEAATQPDAFYQRSARSLQRIGSALSGWNTTGAHDAAIQRLQKQVDGLCSTLDSADPKRMTCGTLLKSPPQDTVQT